MADISHIKYQHIIESLEDIAECAAGSLVLVGGTALALFYLKHRVSVDLDFVPVSGDDAMHKGALKGCLSKKGYRTLRSAYSNQFVIQFEDTSIKVEIFIPDEKLGKIETFDIGTKKILVASLQDLLNMKIATYKRRKKARDIYDVIAILDKTDSNIEIAIDLIKSCGKPEEIEIIRIMETDKKYYKLFEEVLMHATKTDSDL